MKISNFLTNCLISKQTMVLNSLESLHQMISTLISKVSVSHIKIFTVTNAKTEKLNFDNYRNLWNIGFLDNFDSRSIFKATNNLGMSKFIQKPKNRNFKLFSIVSLILFFQICILASMLKTCPLFSEFSCCKNY